VSEPPSEPVPDLGAFERPPETVFQRAGEWYVVQLRRVLRIANVRKRCKAFLELLSGKAARRESLVYDRQPSRPHLMVLRAAAATRNETLKWEFVVTLGTLFGKALGTLSRPSTQRAAQGASWPAFLFSLTDAYVTDVQLTRRERKHLSRSLMAAIANNVPQGKERDPLVTRALEVAVDLHILCEPEFWLHFADGDRRRRYIVMEGLCLNHLEEACRWIRRESYDLELVDILCELLRRLVNEWGRPHVERVIRGHFWRRASDATKERIDQRWGALGFPSVRTSVLSPWKRENSAESEPIVDLSDLDKLCREEEWLHSTARLRATVRAVHGMTNHKQRMEIAVRLASISRDRWRRFRAKESWKFTDESQVLDSVFGLRSFPEPKEEGKNNLILNLSSDQQRMLIACELRFWMAPNNGFGKLEPLDPKRNKIPSIGVRLDSFKIDSQWQAAFDEQKRKDPFRYPGVESFDFVLANNLWPKISAEANR
jgi:hypothetical protein